MAEWLLLLLFALPAPAYVEREEDTAARFGTIAAAVEGAVTAEHAGWPWSLDELATMVATVSWYESGRYAPEVHSGKRKGDGGRSHCLAGIMNVGGTWNTTAEWKRSVGFDLEPTTMCMQLSARFMSRHAARCFGRAPGKLDSWKAAVLFWAYGTGKGCTRKPPKWAQQRAWTWSWMERRRKRD